MFIIEIFFLKNIFFLMFKIQNKQSIYKKKIKTLKNTKKSKYNGKLKN